jgi:hypothetical protein
MITHTFQGIKGTAGALDGHAIITRVRTPRYFTTDGELSWYSPREALGYYYCILLNILHETYIYHIAIHHPSTIHNKFHTSILLATDCYIRIVNIKCKIATNPAAITSDDEEKNDITASSIGNSFSHLGDGIITGGDSQPSLTVIASKTIKSIESLKQNDHILTFKGGSNATGSSDTITVQSLLLRDSKRAIFMIRNIKNGDQKDARRQAILWDLEDHIIDISKRNGHSSTAAASAHDNNNVNNGETTEKGGRIRSSTAPQTPSLNSSILSMTSVVRKDIVLRAKHKVRKRNILPIKIVINSSRNVIERNKMGRKKAHTVYCVIVHGEMMLNVRNKLSKYIVIWNVERRYSDFVKLRGILKTISSNMKRLPSKRVRNMSSYVINERIKGLNQFMNECLVNQSLVQNELFIAFCSTDSEKVRVISSNTDGNEKRKLSTVKQELLDTML